MSFWFPHNFLETFSVNSYILFSTRNISMESFLFLSKKPCHFKMFYTYLTRVGIITSHAVYEFIIHRVIE